MIVILVFFSGLIQVYSSLSCSAWRIVMAIMVLPGCSKIFVRYFTGFMWDFLSHFEQYNEVQQHKVPSADQNWDDFFKFDNFFVA